MIFSEIAGHENLVENLRNMVQAGRMPHAVLFSEQSGCGALPLALATIQFMFCRTRKATQNSICQQFEETVSVSQANTFLRVSAKVLATVLNII